MGCVHSCMTYWFPQPHDTLPKSHDVAVVHVQIIQLKHMFEEFGKTVTQSDLHFLIRVLCNMQVLCDDNLLPLHAVLVTLSIKYGAHAMETLMHGVDPIICLTLAYVYVPRWMRLYIQGTTIRGLNKNPVRVYHTILRDETTVAAADLCVCADLIAKEELYLQMSTACVNDMYTKRSEDVEAAHILNQFMVALHDD